MLGVIGQLLPIAVAVAISSVPIMATLLILLSPRRPRAGVPFLVGWVVGMLVVTSLCVLAAQAIPAARSPRRPDTAVGVAEMLVGAALIVVAIVAWRRERGSASASTPRWLGSIGGVGRWTALAIAVVLNLRPKGLLLAVAAGLTLRAGDLPAGQSWIALAVYTAIGASTVAVPVIATVVDSAGMEPRLQRAQRWMVEHSAALTGSMLALIGIVIIGTGLGRL